MIHDRDRKTQVLCTQSTKETGKENKEGIDSHRKKTREQTSSNETLEKELGETAFVGACKSR